MAWSRPVAVSVVAGAWILVAGAARAADDPGVIPLSIRVGESAPIGPGPVRNLVCDDSTLIQPVEAGGGPALRGVRAGTTLCSVTDALSVRRTFRVVVIDRGGTQGTGGTTPQPDAGR